MPQPRCSFFGRGAGSSASASAYTDGEEVSALRAENEQLRVQNAAKDAEIQRLRIELARLGGSAPPPEPATELPGGAEETEAPAQIAREEAAGECTFWFVTAAAIKAANERSQTTTTPFRDHHAGLVVFRPPKRVSTRYSEVGAGVGQPAN